MSLSTAAGSEMSVCTRSGSPEVHPSRAGSSKGWSCARTRRAPRESRMREIPRPMPVPPPVTKATRLSRLKMLDPKLASLRRGCVGCKRFAQTANLKCMFLSGIVPALGTPLTVDEKLDLEGLRRLIEYILSAGVQGLLANGSM